MNRPTLKRSIGLPALALYGLGTMVGAGFYALIGKVAEEAGVFTPLALLVSAVVASLTGFTYAELSSRFPRAGGEAVYARRAFHRRWPGGAVGWAVILTGVVSAATLSHAFFNYLTVFVQAPEWLVVLLFAAVLGVLTAWGISESVGVAVVITVIEAGGLLAVAVLLGSLDEWRGVTAGELLPVSLEGVSSAAPGLFAGAFLAMYAFIGFEDMVNVAEEVKQPERSMPPAILLALAGTAFLYLLVSVFALLAIPLEEFTASEAPLADIVRAQGSGWALMIGFVGLLAGVNGALVQFVMAARVLYGMAREGMAPRIFDKVHARTRTPVRATLAVTATIGILALGFPLETLARTTSLIILLVFAAMHVSLLFLKRRDPRPEGVRVYPPVLPILGLASIAGLLFMQLRSGL